MTRVCSAFLWEIIVSMSSLTAAYNACKQAAVPTPYTVNVKKNQALIKSICCPGCSDALEPAELGICSWSRRTALAADKDVHFAFLFCCAVTRQSRTMMTFFVLLGRLILAACCRIDNPVRLAYRCLLRIEKKYRCRQTDSMIFYPILQLLLSFWLMLI